MNLSIPKLTLPKFSLPGFLAAKPSAALVIRAGEVEVLRMEGARVAAQARVPIEGPAEEHLTQAIRQAIASADLKSTRLAVSIASPDVLVRFFTIPMIPKSEWDAAVQFEARKYIPFKMETLVWDYYVLPPSALRRSSTSGVSQAQRLEVVLTGIPREVFSRFQAALAAAGVQPTVIEPLSLSLARLAGTADQAPNDFVCLVDIEQERAHLVIAKHGAPYLTRDVNLSASVPTEGAAPAEPESDRRIKQLLSELSVSIDFFTREYTASTISKILLFGEESLLGDWRRRIADQFRYAVELGGGLLKERLNGECPLSFASAAGLLLKDARSGASLDFLKRSLAGAPSTRRRLTMPRGSAANAMTPEALLAALKSPQAIAMGIASMGMLIAVWMFGSQQVSLAQHRLERTISSRPKIGDQLGGMDQAALKPTIETAQQQLALVRRVVDQRMHVAAKLDALARALPDGVWLTDLMLEDPLGENGASQTRLLVNGACFLGESGKELGAIQEFEERVKRSSTLFSGFHSAQLDQINARADAQRQYSYRTFELNCQSGQRL